MNEFRQLTEDVSVSPQITTEQVREAAALGFRTIVNNRPDGEEPGQPSSAEIEAAAREAGMDYHAIPISGGQFDAGSVAQMSHVLENADEPVLAFCRSGTRSTLLWSLARASEGLEPAAIARIAAGAGYDVSPVAAALQALSARRS